MAITAEQCRAARALARIDRGVLSAASGVAPGAIAGFENRLVPPSVADAEALQQALEKLGVDFIPENGGGAGVRLRFARTDAQRLDLWESEGGVAADDDVP